MAPRTAIKRLERRRLADGSTLHFCIPGVDRRHGPHFLSRDEVPEFEGEVAWFEMEWVRTGVWMGWRILRQVEGPTKVPSPLAGEGGGEADG